MKFQLSGKIMYDDTNLNTASGDSYPVSKKVLEEFDASSPDEAIEQAKSIVKEVIDRHCPIVAPGEYGVKRFTSLDVELRIVKAVWKTSVKSGNRFCEPRVNTDNDIQRSHLLT